MNCAIADLPAVPTPEHPTVCEAAERLLAGGVVGLPTETVYGLCATTAAPTSIARLCAAKRRTGDRPFALLLRDTQAVRQWALVPDWAEPILEALWPGALTAVLMTGRAEAALLGSEGAVGIRVPDHGVPQAVAAALESRAGPGAALVATSANRSGGAALNDAGEIAAEFEEEVDMILRCPGRPSGLASTVVDLTGDLPRVLRVGAVSEREILSLARL
jgi:L-threonylcarbamoyladenylate synthase